MSKFFRSLTSEANIREGRQGGEVLRRSNQSLYVSSHESTISSGRTSFSLAEPENNSTVQIVVIGPSLKSLNNINVQSLSERLPNDVELMRLEQSRFRLVRGIEYPIATALVPDKPVQTIDNAHEHSILSLTLSSSGTIIATGDTTNKLTLWLFADGSKITTLDCDVSGPILNPIQRAILPFRRRASYSGTSSSNTAKDNIISPVNNINPLTSLHEAKSVVSMSSNHVSPPLIPILPAKSSTIASGSLTNTTIEEDDTGGSIGVLGNEPITSDFDTSQSVIDPLKEETRNTTTNESRQSISSRTSIQSSITNDETDKVDKNSPSPTNSSKNSLLERLYARSKRHSVSEGASNTKGTLFSFPSRHSFTELKFSNLFSSTSSSGISKSTVVRPGVYCISFSPDDLYLACAVAVPAAGHIIHVWKLANKKIKVTFYGHTMRINGLQFSRYDVQESRQLISCSSDGTVRVWDRIKNRGTHLLRTGSAVMDFCIRQELIVTAQFMGEIQAWDINAQTKLWVVSQVYNGIPVLSVINGPEKDDHTIIAYSKDGIIRVFRLSDGKLIYEMSHPSMKSVSNFNKITMSMDNSILSVGMANGSMAVWDYTRRQILALVNQHNANVTGMAWNLGGNLISTSEDKKLIVWDGRELGDQHLRSQY